MDLEAGSDVVLLLHQEALEDDAQRVAKHVRGPLAL